MTADMITAIKKALETLRQPKSMSMFASQGDMISDLLKERTMASATLESLQRENEESQELARAFEAEANQLREVSIANRHRAEAAEAEVKRYREALHIISAGHACPIALANNALRHSALSITGDTHGN